ncbi:hypothetical protein [uncultured Enterovirga sp.]|uniref:hypothetical protein n=1 Tax=uncultured Enterovirga sp. TaxID=2026352 RepID=UPI0035CC7740
MADGTTNLSDKALAVFAFAAYHQLGSGQPVKSVIRDDGQGHRADEAGVAELQSAGLVEPGAGEITFTSEGLTFLSRAIEGMRTAGLQS